MTVSTFNFHLLRICIAQLLKAHGFDKTNNRALDVVTDLFIRYLRLLTLTVIKYTDLRNDEESVIQDFGNAFRELRIISPANIIDPYDIGGLTSRGITNFENWFMSEMQNRIRDTARPNIDLINEIIKTKKMKDVNTKMSTLTAALDQQTQQAQRQNPTLPYQYQSMGRIGQTGNRIISENQRKFNKDGRTDYNGSDDLTVDDDWIKFVIRQQLNQHPDVKFKGTILINNLPQDKKMPRKRKIHPNVTVSGPAPKRLESVLPYKQRADNDRLLQEIENDDDEQISKYKQKRNDYFPQVQLASDEDDTDHTENHSLNIFQSAN